MGAISHYFWVFLIFLSFSCGQSPSTEATRGLSSAKALQINDRYTSRLSSRSAAELCFGTEFFDKDGLRQSGLKLCTPEDALKACKQAKAPSFAVSTNSDMAQSVTIQTDTSNATIFYTLDGSQPTPESPLYREAILISRDTNISAMAIAEGLDPSPVVSQAFWLLGTVETPLISPNPGTFEGAQVLTITVAGTPGASIYYTVTS